MGLFKRRRPSPAEGLYMRIAALGRAPRLYLSLGVPDTAEGRFEALSLHVALVLRRMKTLAPPADEVGQDLVDIFFRELDRGLRELGVGDLSVGKRIKKLAQAFYGRAAVYDAALAKPDDTDLAAALGRNILADETVVAGDLAAYVRQVEAHLAMLSLDDLLTDQPVLPD